MILDDKIMNIDVSVATGKGVCYNSTKLDDTNL